MTNEEKSLQRLADLIAERYDFGQVERPEYLVAAHQRRHRKLTIDTSIGRFLIKTYKSTPEVLDTLRFQHRLSNHMAQHGLPVAQIAATKSGPRILEFDSWAAELQRFLPGGSMQVTTKTLPQSAVALGCFHEAGRAFPCPNRETRKWRFSEVPREMFTTLYEAAIECGDRNRVDDDCNELGLFLQNARESLTPEICNQFETGLIHGDWHGGNLLFHEDRLTGIIDFEFAGEGCYLEDLAYAISNLCVRTSTKPDRLNARTDMLLEFYQRHRRLAPTETRALYYAVGVKHIGTVAYQSRQQGSGVAGMDAAQWMSRLRKQCLWLEARTRLAYG